MKHMRHVYNIPIFSICYVNHMYIIYVRTWNLRYGWHLSYTWYHPLSPGTDHQISSLVPYNFQLTSQTSFNPLLDDREPW